MNTLFKFLLFFVYLLIIILSYIQYIDDNKNNFKIDNIIIKKYNFFNILNNFMIISIFLLFILHLFLSI